MARLGAVLGGVLAEIARARVISDQLTRELVDEYEGDPVLNSMSVPRVTISGADIVVRFTVSDFEEGPEPQPDASAVRDAWLTHAKNRVIPAVLADSGLNAEARSEVLGAVSSAALEVVGRPRISDIRAALNEETRPASDATSRPILDAWTSIPVSHRRTIGNKNTFRRKLNDTLEAELSSFIKRHLATETIQAALASKIDVAVKREQLADEDPARVQEIRLSLSSQDLDVVLTEPDQVS